MVHPIKEPLQIHINHPTTTGSNILTGITHRLMSAPARAESVARIREVRIKNKLQNLMQSLLNETIQHRRNAELPHAFAAGLGYFHPPYRLRLITTIQQLAFDARPVLAKITFKGIHGHAIHTRRTLVGSHAP
ncbi:hypothetical protein BMS3Abin14_00996 [bacterium BMS3Abin14]|nr:hypothetical protein BMS3Abin14_00996 [bacterium BMS3Abin14]